MYLSINKKNNVNPSIPQFYYIKVGLKGPKLYRHVFVMGKVMGKVNHTALEAKQNMKKKNVNEAI